MRSLWFENNFVELFSIQYKLKILGGGGRPKTLVSYFITFLIGIMQAHNPVNIFQGLKISYSKMHAY